jgi:hypothetical protein
MYASLVLENALIDRVHQEELQSLISALKRSASQE